MLARVIVIATCLSVRPSRAGIVSKRRKLAAWFLHRLVAPRLWFSDAKFHHQILRGSPRTGASNKGRSEKFSDFVALSVNISKTVADTAKVTISD